MKEERLKSAVPAASRVRPRLGSWLSCEPKAGPQETAFYADVELAYRTLCALLFNFAPNSGHPGGSLSSGLIASALVFDGLDYDLSDPDAPWADLLCYAAGHKALGLYALYALRNELARVAAPDLLADEPGQLRLEDLLGFRKNPTQRTPLIERLRARHLDGHPTPATPFVPIATGASGVGFAGAVGLALAARDAAGDNAPRVHVVEGEGGLTPGRVHEALSAAATAGLSNLLVHVDWNQASIDSNRVCAEGEDGGDYVQWDPRELFALHDWNVVDAGDGHDISRVLSAQRQAASLENGRPTAVVYRTVKGWRYGIEGRASHGAGHEFCSAAYFSALEPFEKRFETRFDHSACDRARPDAVERHYHSALMTVRCALEKSPALARAAARRLEDARRRLRALKRQARPGGPRVELLHAGLLDARQTPEALRLSPGKPASLRAALGAAIGRLNAATRGAFLVCAADLCDSTSVSAGNEGFPKGFFHASKNPASRLIPAGGICEDAMGAMMAAASAYGRHVGVTSSYSAFIAALEHVAARLHAIGQQARRDVSGEPFRTWIMVNAHAGPMTGEDGPTHADPQALQLLQGNFPQGQLITLTPWEPQEVWPLLAAGLSARPSVLCPFVTRPPFPVPDRAALKLPEASAAAKGLYAFRRSRSADATVVLQGCAATLVFATEVLPQLDAEGLELNVFCVTSAELFDRLPREEREELFPDALARAAMGITDFTLPTLERWVRSQEGRAASLHPFRGGRFLGTATGGACSPRAGSTPRRNWPPCAPGRAPSPPAPDGNGS